MNKYVYKYVVWIMYLYMNEFIYVFNCVCDIIYVLSVHVSIFEIYLLPLAILGVILHALLWFIQVHYSDIVTLNVSCYEVSLIHLL